jgi:predicted peptidase
MSQSSLLRFVLPSLLLVLGVSHAQNKSASWLTSNFQARTHYSVPRSDSMKYRLFVPVGYNPAVKYPIVIALHGIGERGYNNVNQLTLEELAQPWVRDSVQAKHPHLVMVPQCPPDPAVWWASNGGWSGNRSKSNIMITEALDSLKKEFSLDTTRFYIVGLSMGGFGTIELMKWRPELWAAAIPTAGGGDTAATAITQLVKTPTWFFHSLTDPTVSATRGSRTLAQKFKAAGKPVVFFASDSQRTNVVPFDSLNPATLVSLDSLRKAVYVNQANYLYSEVRRYVVTGSNRNPMHQAGWWEAWRHPMITDWLFSKRKVNGVTALSAAAPQARLAAPKARLVMGNGGLLLERLDASGNVRLYNLEGRLAAPAR